MTSGSLDRPPKLDGYPAGEIPALTQNGYSKAEKSMELRRSGRAEPLSLSGGRILRLQLFQERFRAAEVIHVQNVDTLAL